MTPWTHQQVEYVARVRLPRQRGGFAISDVDGQLQRILALMRAGQAVPPIAATDLRRTRFGQGYEPERVEALLARITAWQRDLDQRKDPQPVPESGPAEQAPPSAQRPRWTSQQQEWVRQSSFRTRRGSGAYDMEEVDDFLDAVLHAMANGEPLPDVESVQFRSPGLRSGYDESAVDEFLDQLAALRPADPDGTP